MKGLADYELQKLVQGKVREAILKYTAEYTEKPVKNPAHTVLEDLVETGVINDYKIDCKFHGHFQLELNMKVQRVDNGQWVTIRLFLSTMIHNDRYTVEYQDPKDREINELKALNLRLRIALQSAWPYIHSGCTIETVRNEVANLMHGKDEKQPKKRDIDKTWLELRSEVIVSENPVIGQKEAYQLGFKEGTTKAAELIEDRPFNNPQAGVLIRAIGRAKPHQQALVDREDR